MSEDAPPPYVAVQQTETDEGQCRTALRQINHWLDDDSYLRTEETMRTMLTAVKRRVGEVLSAPRSNGAVIDKLEEEVGRLRGQILDYRAADMARRLKQSPQPSERIAGPLESLVNAKLGARAARLDSWLRVKIPL